LWLSSLRQLFCAASTSLNTIASAVLFERQPFERIVRCRTVAKVLSIGFEVRRCCATSWREDVGGRVKPGHDEREG
jgi:hypothetical protein